MRAGIMASMPFTHSYPQARITSSVTVSSAEGVHLFTETSGTDALLPWER